MNNKLLLKENNCSGKLHEFDINDLKKRFCSRKYPSRIAAKKLFTQLGYKRTQYEGWLIHCFPRCEFVTEQVDYIWNSSISIYAMADSIPLSIGFAKRIVIKSNRPNAVIVYQALSSLEAHYEFANLNSQKGGLSS